MRRREFLKGAATLATCPVVFAEEANAFWQSRSQVAVSGGGPSFPTGIGLVARWRADVGVTVVGGNATSVADQSGNGNTIAPVGTVPWSATGSANGKPAFIFDGSNALAMAGLTANMGSGSAVSVFAVAQVQIGASGLVSLIGTPGANDYSDGSGANALSFQLAGSQIRTDQAFANLLNFSLSFGPQYRLGVFIDGVTSANQYLNNTPGTPIPMNYTQSATTQIAVGNRITAGAVSTSQGWVGTVSEVVVTNTILTTPQLNALDAYFTDQWGT